MSEPTDPGAVSWTRAAVHLERRLSAAPRRVWAAWTDAGWLSRWLGPVERGVPGPGATFVLRMAAAETATCTVTRWEPPRLLELVWDYSGERPSRLRLELRAEDAGTHLVLDHDRLDGADGPLDYGAGWQAHLAVLAANLAGTPMPVFDKIFPPLRAAYAAQPAADRDDGRESG